MDIYTLACEKRDLAIKAKKIRNNGFVPAVVYGRNIDSLSIQIQQSAATKFLQKHSIGSRVLLEIDGEEQMAILKEFQIDPASRKLLHIDFLALTTGEKIKVTVPISFLHRDSIGSDSFLQEQMSEIEISTLPKFLVDNVTLDVSKYQLGDSVYVSDLDIINDENIEVISPLDSLVCSITHAARLVEEEPEEDEVAAADVELVSDESTEEVEE